MFHCFHRAAAPLLALSLFSTFSAKAADLNLVGSEMIRILQNGHYARLPYDQKLGLRFFDEYIEGIDPEKIYFTQPEVDNLRQKYGTQFHDLLVEKEILEPATEIFELYRSRVKEQVSMVQKLLKEDKFTYDSARSIVTDREDLDWPKGTDAMHTEWSLMLEDLLISEIIRRERLDQLAKKQGKESPFQDNFSVAKKISLRYERFLKAVSESEEEDIANHLFSAVARSHDPHCEYQSPREHEQFRINVSNQLVGIGASLGVEDDGATKIHGIVNGGPADRQGNLKLGDRIIAVDPLNDGNFESIMFLPISKVVEKILGKQGTEVGLKISDGDTVDAPGHVVVIKRGKVTIKDELVTAKIFQFASGKKLGLIHIPSFYFTFGDGSKSVSEDLKQILKRLMKENVDGIALDLRNNGGGSLDEVATLTGFFIPRGPVVQTKTTSSYVSSLKSSARRPLYEGPLVMLTNKSSASATEILAAALQDYNRAVVIGESSTYGKGTIQQAVDISRFMPFFTDRARTGWIKFTTGKYYRASGESVQQRGVVPDILLPGLSDATEYGEAFAKYALPYDIIQRAAGFDPLNRQNLFIPILKEKSTARLKKNKDFQYLNEDIARIKKENDDPRLSLNLATRRAKLAEAQKRRETRNAERRTRFAAIEKADQKDLKVFRLTLDDIDKRTLPLADKDSDDETYMRKEKNKIADLDDTPEWPSAIHPIEREGLDVLLDLVEVIRTNRIAGTLKD